MKNRLFIGIITLVLIMLAAAACSGKKSGALGSSASAGRASLLSSEEWENLVSEYETFVDTYAELFRKTVTEGGTSDEELEKQEHLLGYWAEYFHSIEGQLSEEQEAVINEIHVKLIMVVMGLN